MRLRAALLHVLVIAPAAVLTAGVLGATVHASAAAGGAPAPIVVTIDPGHGGSPGHGDPTLPFDPGAIGVNGVLEKDVTLDVSQRAAALLRADLVDVVLTRTDDRNMTIPDREQVAIDARAAVFLSVHCNSFTDSGASGSIVLYPNAMGQPFAQALSGALGAQLAADAVPDDGVVLRDNWWTHAPMPTSTVEMAYLSNPHEAALMATEGFRQDVAIAIRSGIERFLPSILARKAAILAWRHAHPGDANPVHPPTAAPAGAATSSAHGSSPVAAIIVWLLVVGIVVSVAIRPDAARRRRHQVRRRAAGRTHQWAPRSVYDELSL